MTEAGDENSTPHPDSDALPNVPLDWVALSDLPGHIASWYGVSVTVIAAAVVDSVWTGELRPWHRIAGIKPDGRWRQLPDGLTDTGVRPIHDPRPDVPFDYRIVAHDSAAADVDRRKGTVGGWPQKGVRERLAIEVPWIAVKEWASARVERWQRDAAGELKTKAAAIRATLAQITDHADKPGERTPNEWMADYAKAQLALNGAPAKREDALRACREGACCTYRKALEAWNGLPVSMKRKPRETDRALTGR